jgi:hypothetical protein
VRLLKALAIVGGAVAGGLGLAALTAGRAKAAHVSEYDPEAPTAPSSGLPAPGRTRDSDAANDACRRLNSFLKSAHIKGAAIVANTPNGMFLVVRNFGMEAADRQAIPATVSGLTVKVV